MLRPRDPAVTGASPARVGASLRPGRRGFALVATGALLLLAVGCGVSPGPGEGADADVALLTRDGCPNALVMRERLEAAVAALGGEVRVTVVDVGRLGAEDPRTGYGTPTVLVGGVDLFGAPTPGPAPPT